MKNFKLYFLSLILVSQLNAFEEFLVSDIRIIGLQRVSTGSIFNVIPISVGDKIDLRKSTDITKSLFSTEQFDDIQIAKDGNTLIISVVERPSISAIDISGNKALKTEQLIESLDGVGIKEGEVYKRSTLEKVRSELVRSYSSNGRYGANVEIDEVRQSRNRIDINITVDEKPTGEISAGAGIGTNGGSFGISISENNWLGEGKKVQFEIETDEETLSADILYTDPNYNFLGNQISYNLFSRNNDKPDQGFENTLVGAGISTKFEQYKNLFTSLGTSVSYDDLRTIDTASTALKKQSGEFTEFTGNYGFSYDTRDRAFMPTSGSISSFNQILPFIADKRYIKNSLSSSIYRTLSEDVIGASKFYFSSINGLGGEDVRVNKRSYLGTKRIRGFKSGKIGPVDGTEHIGGNYATALNFEANLPKILPESTNMDFGLFLDFANVWGVDYDSSIDDGSKIRSSTGVALNWSSPIGPMTFILSQNLSKASTDETESFNFNLGTTF